MNESDSGKPRTKGKYNLLAKFSFSSATQRHVHKLLRVAGQTGNLHLPLLKQWNNTIWRKEREAALHYVKATQDVKRKPWPCNYRHFHLLREVLPKWQVGLYIQPKLKLQAVRGETFSHCPSIERSAQQVLIWLALTTVIEVIVWHSAMSSFQVKKQDPLEAQVNYNVPLYALQ